MTMMMMMMLPRFKTQTRRRMTLNVSNIPEASIKLTTQPLRYVGANPHPDKDTPNFRSLQNVAEVWVENTANGKKKNK
jgi:hypothetical protein